MEPRPISVLIVDDEPVLRELVAFILFDKGCKVLEADSGRGAFEILSREIIDVVVSDVRMPNGSGLDLLNWIVHMDRTKPIVFLVSGYSEISQEDAIKFGAYDLLHKPVDYDNLFRSIVASLQQQQRVQV